MDCLNCGNCKDNQPTYYCLMKSEVVINGNYKPGERHRTGWKKGTADYEKHRRLYKKEIDE